MPGLAWAVFSGDRHDDTSICVPLARCDPSVLVWSTLSSPAQSSPALLPSSSTRLCSAGCHQVDMDAWVPPQKHILLVRNLAGRKKAQPSAGFPPFRARYPLVLLEVITRTALPWASSWR